MTGALKDDPDQALTKALHGTSASSQNAFLAMLRKNNATHRDITNEYIRQWKTEKDADATTEEAREGRREEYMGVVNK